MCSHSRESRRSHDASTYTTLPTSTHSVRRLDIGKNKRKNKVVMPKMASEKARCTTEMSLYPLQSTLGKVPASSTWWLPARMRCSVGHCECPLAAMAKNYDVGVVRHLLLDCASRLKGSRSYFSFNLTHRCPRTKRILILPLSQHDCAAPQTKRRALFKNKNYVEGRFV